MNRFRQSVILSAGDRYGSLALFLCSMAILSRVLTPEEFGIYSVITALMALATTLREFGGANYLIQKQDLSEHCVRTAFTVTLLMCCLLVVVLVTLRDAAASFYAASGLREGVTVSALNFLLLPFSVTISALLRREMAFHALAICNLTSNLVMAVTSVGLAALGLSFMGPVWGSVAGNLTMTMLLLAYRRDIRIFRPSLRNWRDVVSFGVYSSATVIINVIYQWSPQLILGRIVNFTAVGLYGRAVNVTQVFDKLVLNVLNPVIMPAIAAKARGGSDLRPIYLLAVELITALHWPCLVFVALMADPIVRLIFGAQWIDAVPLVRMLALASLSLFSACLTYPVLVSIGRVRDTLTASFIAVPPSLLAIFAASFFGLQAVAASAFVTLPLQAVVALTFVCRRIGLHPRDLVRAIRKSGIVTISTTIGVVLTIGIDDFNLSVSNLGFFASGLGAAIGWSLGLVITKHPLLTQLHLALAQSPFNRVTELLGSPSPRRRAKAAQP